MNISVLGLGYVGCVSAACLARAGHQVVGVDVAEEKVRLVSDGRSPILEPGIDELIADGVRSGRLRATTDVVAAVAGSDLSVVCVGTPSRDNGAVERQFLWNVARQVGSALHGRDGFHVTAQRSTALPGTCDEIARLIAKWSGKTLGHGFGVASNPEFLREGSAIADFGRPPYTIIGASDERTANVLAGAYSGIEAPVLCVGMREAEMLKYVCNAFHAVKVSFANEMGNLCRELGVDSHAVMKLFVQDTKLNIAPTYLMPGFAFGGSCLPKDVSALRAEAQERHVSTPLLDGVMDANAEQLRQALHRLMALGKKRVAVLGLSFKTGTDDLRNSPAVALVETLIGKGYDVGVYDPDVDIPRLLGANRRYIEQEIPHLAKIIHVDSAPLLARAEVVVVTKKSPAYRELVRRAHPGQVVLDLVRVVEAAAETPARYDGFSW